MSDTNEPRPPRCIHMTCKAMMVYGEDFEEDPDFQDGMDELECLKSLDTIGPDLEELSLEKCSDPERECYEGY